MSVAIPNDRHTRRPDYVQLDQCSTSNPPSTRYRPQERLSCADNPIPPAYASDSTGTIYLMQIRLYYASEVKLHMQIIITLTQHITDSEYVSNSDTSDDDTPDDSGINYSHMLLHTYFLKMLQKGWLIKIQNTNKLL